MPALIGTDLLEAARLLTANELVAIPTETVYGLATKPTHASVKKRVADKKRLGEKKANRTRPEQEW